MTDPTSRALSLLGLLESRAVWSGTDLADRLGVTTRTVRRDIERLRSLGYTVDANPGADGGYSLGRSQLLPPLLLDEEQAVAVTLALLEAVRSGDRLHSQAALRALSTIDNVTPAPVRARTKSLRSVVTTPGATRDSTEPDALLACADAVRRHVRLAFDYTDRNGVSTRRSVNPHQLLVRGRGWLLVAFDLDRDDWRLFRVDRLTDPRPGTLRFTPRDDLDAALDRFAQPVPAEAWRHRVEAHIAASLDEVTSQRPHLANYVEAVDADTTLLTAGASDPDDAAGWLAHLPWEFTLLGDDAVRDAVSALARRLSSALNATDSTARASDRDARWPSVPRAVHQ